ncbi:CYTH domain-containing protein [Microbacterium amylolyticum]|uniref:Inorganic triphosphatase YgiF n=1 Tax=Microbacterium amylolyticum TaxID=936337 RepID=A0ABS4ZFF2_9MICO|nr:CYTH domain-containing protein [Microbacterium amylolyticum]MBP2436019.1 inorganic triphosphatase YgiF [Microbacterium amylolyticum]
MASAISSREIERKFDVAPGTPVPDWTGVPGVHTVSPGDERHLDALYLDTEDLALGRRGVAVRRRTGGPDAGWHIKGPLIDGGRVEMQWPLTLTDDVPQDVRDALATWTDSTEFTPLAKIVNDRTAYELRDSAGGVVAEFAADRVSTVDLRRGVERAWCEWEMELGPAAPDDIEAFFAAVAERAIAAGATAPSSASKLARALGL